MSNPLDDYLNALDRRMLLVPKAVRADSRREIETHLRARAAEFEVSGLAPADALARALRDFGDPRALGSDLARRHFRHRTVKRLFQCAGVLFAVYAVLVLWSLLAGSQPAQPAPKLAAVANPQAELRAIIVAQNRVKNGIVSLRCEMGRDTTVSYKGHHIGTFGDRIEMAFKGEKSWTRRWPGYPATEYGRPVETTFTSVTDGKMAYEIVHEGIHQSIFLRDLNGPRESIPPTFYGYKIGDIWLADVLTKGKPVVEGTTVSPTFGPLTVVRLPNLRLWFAPRLGSMVVKRERISPHRWPAFPGAMSQATDEVTQAANVGGFWLPTAMTMHGTSVFAGREKRRYGNIESRFTNLAVNDVPDALFSPLKPGTRVLDFSKPEGRVYVQGTDGRLTTHGIPVFSVTLWQRVRWLVESNWLAFGLLVTVLLGGFGLWAWDVRQRHRPNKPMAA